MCVDTINLIEQFVPHIIGFACIYWLSPILDLDASIHSSMTDFRLDKSRSASSPSNEVWSCAVYKLQYLSPRCLEVQWGWVSERCSDIFPYASHSKGMAAGTDQRFSSDLWSLLTKPKVNDKCHVAIGHRNSVPEIPLLIVLLSGVLVGVTNESVQRRDGK